METVDRHVALPSEMQGRWVDVDEPAGEIVISGGEINYHGRAVDYDFKEIDEIEGTLTVNFSVADPRREDAFQRENIAGLALTSGGELHAWNVKFAATFVRSPDG